MEEIQLGPEADFILKVAFHVQPHQRELAIRPAAQARAHIGIVPVAVVHNLERYETRIRFRVNRNP